MKLTGGFKGSKSGVFTPEGSDDSYPWIFAKIVDEDSDGYIKVKPSSSDDEDVAEFSGIVAGLNRGDHVSWVVTVDSYGKVRFVAESA